MNITESAENYIRDGIHKAKDSAENHIHAYGRRGSFLQNLYIGNSGEINLNVVFKREKMLLFLTFSKNGIFLNFPLNSSLINRDVYAEICEKIELLSDLINEIKY